MTPQIHPGSSKMVPERLTEIGGTHFDAPPGSQMTPSAPKATLGVPQRTVWAPHGAQTDLKSTPRGAKATSPGMQSHPPGAPWVLWVLPVLSLSRFFFFPLFFCVVPVFAAVVVFCCCRCSKFYCYDLLFAPPRPRLNNPSARLLTEPGRRNAQSD